MNGLIGMQLCVNLHVTEIANFNEWCDCDRLYKRCNPSEQFITLRYDPVSTLSSTDSGRFVSSTERIQRVTQASGHLRLQYLYTQWIYEQA